MDGSGEPDDGTGEPPVEGNDEPPVEGEDDGDGEDVGDEEPAPPPPLELPEELGALVDGLGTEGAPPELVLQPPAMSMTPASAAMMESGASRMPGDAGDAFTAKCLWWARTVRSPLRLR
ncbi:MAG TPA: hypothetical protein VGO53_01995 [Steroidobacteraceae bacterium]|jgi:hypothetical protein|nr:hypothetical protein [Steroidobacteraceae bacterium]